MPTATLRAVGGSVVMAIPKRLLELVNLQTGSQVRIEVQHGNLIVAPLKKKRYTLAELLAQCDAAKPLSAQESAWLDAPDVGLENEGGSH
jgi:antitoxin ChpS